MSRPFRWKILIFVRRWCVCPCKDREEPQARACRRSSGQRDVPSSPSTQLVPQAELNRTRGELNLKLHWLVITCGETAFSRQRFRESGVATAESNQRKGKLVCLRTAWNSAYVINSIQGAIRWSIVVFINYLLIH